MNIIIAPEPSALVSTKLRRRYYILAGLLTPIKSKAKRVNLKVHPAKDVEAEAVQMLGSALRRKVTLIDDNDNDVTGLMLEHKSLRKLSASKGISDVGKRKEQFLSQAKA